jgi:hypothetical protein
MTAPVRAPADDAAVTALVLAIANLRAESWESDRVGNGEAHGLARPALRVSWTTQLGATDSAGTSLVPKTTLRLSAPKPGSKSVYANIEGDPRVFKVSVSLLSALECDLHDKRVFDFKPEEAQRVVLRWPSRTLALVRAAEPGGTASSWRADTAYDDSGFDVARLGPLVSDLAALRTPGFLQYSGPIPAGAGLVDPRLTIEVKTTGREAPLLKVGNTLKDGSFAATTAAGPEGAVFLLPSAGAWKQILASPLRVNDLPEDVFTTGRPPVQPSR